MHSLSDVPVAEEKLAAKVALLYDIVIRDGGVAIGSADAHTRKILHELAAKGTSTDQEQIQSCQLLLQRFAKDANLPVMACALDT